MNIGELVGSALDLAWELTRSIQREGVYRRVVSTGYDPVTGNPTPVTQDIAVRFLVTAYEEPDGVAIRMGDEKVVLRMKDLPAGLQPQADDQLVETGGPVRVVVGVTLDPTNRALVLQTRRLGL